VFGKTYFKCSVVLSCLDVKFMFRSSDKMLEENSFSGEEVNNFVIKIYVKLLYGL
jgi:hypothetical protein